MSQAENIPPIFFKPPPPKKKSISPILAANIVHNSRNIVPHSKKYYPDIGARYRTLASLGYGANIACQIQTDFARFDEDDIAPMKFPLSAQ